MNRADLRLPDPELEHLPPEVRELAQHWREPMPEGERAEALARLESSARETGNLGVLWALEAWRRSRH